MPITPFADYKQHADECRLLAFLTTKVEQKAMLEDMARGKSLRKRIWSLSHQRLQLDRL